MPVFRRLAALLSTLALTLLVVVALLVSALRLALPYADGYRETLAETLTQRLGYQVAIHALSLELSGWTPRLMLQQVVLSAPGSDAEALRFTSLGLELDILGSLHTAAPQIRSLTLAGASLEWRRLPDGQLRLTGLGALQNDQSPSLARFLEQGQINLTDSDIRFVDELRGGALVQFRDVHLALLNQGQQHQLHLSARLVPAVSPAGGSNPSDTLLHLNAELDGPPDNLNVWQGRIAARLSGADLSTADLGGLLPLDRLSARANGRFVLESWNQIRAGRLEQSLWQIDLAGLALIPPASADGSSVPTAIDLGPLSALAQLQPLDSGWQIQVASLKAGLKAGISPSAQSAQSAADITLQLSATGTLTHLDLHAPHLQLAELASVLRASQQPLPDALARLLVANPRGVVRDLALNLTHSPDAQPWQWRATVILSNVRLDHAPSVPGITGLDAHLSATQDGGVLDLDAADLSLDLNPLFSERLTFAQAGGQLGWRRDAAGDWLLSGDGISVENADFAGQTRFTLTFPADRSSPFLDLRARFAHQRLAHLRPYLPVGIMHPHLVDWLTRSIRSGRVPQADIVFRGPLAQHPFHHNEGRFELMLPFVETLLDYQPGWPPITSAAGHLHFLNQGLTIEVERGRIYDSAFSNGRVEIPRLGHLRRMQIHGEAEGPFTDGVRTLAETPLADKLGRLAATLTATGTSRLALDIDLPLVKDEDPLRLAGHLSWPAAASLAIKGTPLALTNLAGGLDLTAHSLTATSIKAQLWGQPLQLAIRTESAGDPERALTRIDASTHTPVTELARRWPSPLWDHLDDRLDWTLGVTLRHRDVGHEALALDYSLSSALRGLAINLPAPLGKPTGVARPLALTGTLVPGRALVTQGQLGELALNLRVGLDTKTPDVAGHLRFGSAPASAPKQPGLFIDGTLSELNLRDWSDWFGSRTASAKRQTPPVSADHWLAGAQLHVERLHWGQATLGALDLALHQDAAGIHLSHLELDEPGLMFASGTGDWSHAADSERSRLDLTLGTANLSALARALDDQSGLDAGQAVATLHLNWPGGRDALAWPQTVGTIDLTVADGRLPKVEPGIGRLLGFLNLAALNRRLMLDFSDLYGEGFAFEDITGQIALGAGRARFNEVVIAGPAGKLIVGGTADLKSRSLNQTVTVEPRLGSSVALASAVVGGPLLGAAVYLVDRVAGNPLDQLGRYRYRVTGPWSEPVLRPLGWEPWMQGAAAIESLPRASSARKESVFLNAH